VTDTGEEWTFDVLPNPEDVRDALARRTGWPFRVDPVERGVLAIVAVNGEGGIRWSPVAEDVVRVDVHERITPYLSWQFDAALIAAGGKADHKLESPPIALVPWSDLGRWQRIRYGARGWILQVVLIVVLAVPVLLVGALFMTSRGPAPRDEDDR
jgi:hypothetical protein